MQKTTVSRDSVIKRINRRLRAEGERLHTARSDVGLREFGQHYTTDSHSGAVTAKHVCLEQLARELRVLATAEAIQA